jgi:hypothetical protein
MDEIMVPSFPSRSVNETPSLDIARLSAAYRDDRVSPTVVMHGICDAIDARAGEVTATADNSARSIGQLVVKDSHTWTGVGMM